MKSIKNVSPLGDLDLPTVGVVVASGEVIEVADGVAESLIATEHFTAADKKEVKK